MTKPEPIAPEPTNQDDCEVPPQAGESRFTKLKNRFKNAKIEDVLDDTSILSIDNTAFKGGVGKIVRVINSRVIKRATNLAKGVLNITEKVKEGNAISVGAAAISSLDLVLDFFEIERADALDTFTNSKGLTLRQRGHLVEMILSPNVLASISREVFWEDADRILFKFQLGINNFIYLLQTNKLATGELEFYKKYYIDDTFDYNVAYKCFWSFFENKIYLTNKNDGSERTDHVRLNPLVFNTFDLLLDQNELAKVGTEIQSCHKNGLSRSYLLVGPPGTGKSSFCFAAAEKFCPRILKIDPSVMGRMASGELEYFIDGLLPDAIIFDDIDRCDTEGYLLFVLENIKKAYPNVVLFATANDFEELGAAMVRPGRFDRVLWIDNPDLKTRDIFIRHYSQVLNLAITEDLMEQTIASTDGFSQAYLIEMLMRCRYDADLPESLAGTIREFRRTLKMEMG